MKKNGATKKHIQTVMDFEKALDKIEDTRKNAKYSNDELKEFFTQKSVEQNGLGEKGLNRYNNGKYTGEVVPTRIVETGSGLVIYYKTPKGQSRMVSVNKEGWSRKSEFPAVDVYYSYKKDKEISEATIKKLEESRGSSGTKAKTKTFDEKVKEYVKIEQGDLINNPENIKSFIEQLIELDNVDIDAEEKELLLGVST